MKSAGLVALLVFVYSFPPIHRLADSLDPQRVIGWLEPAGGWAPLVFVGLMAAVVVVSPIPSLPLDLAAGAYFGPFWGGLYAVVGGLLGAIVSFLLARLLGRRLMERFSRGHVSLCRECSDKVLTKVVFLARLLPVFSFDLVSYGAGLTGMSLGKFALATGLGMMPATFAYTYFGSVIRVGKGAALLGGVLMVVLFLLLPRWLEKYDVLGMGRLFRQHADQTAPAAED